MDIRPDLQKNLSAETFLSYYYLKEELMAFCKDNGLPAGGSKSEITDRIAHYLKTGEIRQAERIAKRGKSIGEITLDTVIEPNFVCSERHRAFFRAQIGKRFSFKVPFQTWLKANAGKTYAEAVAAYSEILEEKKKSKTAIDKQFEYNTYIRDFFADNPGLSLQDAIRCWKHKKSRPGHNRYEKTDLTALAAGSVQE